MAQAVPYVAILTDLIWINFDQTDHPGGVLAYLTVGVRDVPRYGSARRCRSNPTAPG